MLAGSRNVTQILDQLVAVVKLDGGVHVHLDPAPAVDDPPAEVPRQLLHLTWVFLINQLLCVSSQELKHRVRVGPIDIDLVSEREGYAVLVLGRLLNLLVWVRLLVQELAAREADDLQASL